MKFDFEFFFFNEWEINKQRHQKEKKSATPGIQSSQGICLRQGGHTFHNLNESLEEAPNLASQSAILFPSLKMWVKETFIQEEDKLLMLWIGGATA